MLLSDLYTVENFSATNGLHSTNVKINKDHRLYNGHFPNRPVTPGVILMQLFKEEAERLCGHNLQLERAINVKFMAVVDPNDDENLLLESTIEENEAHVSLKGVAKHKGAISLKINAIYKIIKEV